jgi:hypothetical protein
LRLTWGALAEMRTLLFAVDLEVEGEHKLAGEVQMVFHRVAQRVTQ